MKWHEKHIQESSFLDRVSDKVANFFGAWACVVLHTAWFLLWFYLKLDVSLLTNIVSLEAIYLTMLVLMSSNRAGQRDRHQSDADHENNRQAKLEIEQLQIAIGRVEDQHLKVLTEKVDKLLKKKK